MACGTSRLEPLIVRGVFCVLLGSTEAAFMGNFTPISRRPAKCAMRIAWVHSGALRAPLCIQGDVMAHFAGRREIGVKFPMRAASVDPKSTQLTPLTIAHKSVKAALLDDRRPTGTLLSKKRSKRPSRRTGTPPEHQF